MNSADAVRIAGNLLNRGRLKFSDEEGDLLFGITSGALIVSPGRVAANAASEHLARHATLGDVQDRLDGKTRTIDG